MANEQTSVPLYAASEVLTAANMNISAGTGVPVFATTVTRDAAFGGAGEKVLAEGQLCYLSSTNVVQQYNGASWETVGPSSSNSAIWLNTQNGYGSSSTAIYRFTNIVANTGTDITYADSATLGSTFTINKAGVYSMSMWFNNSPTGGEIAFSLNSTQLTTRALSITNSTRLSLAYNGGVDQVITSSTSAYLQVNDVIRPHGNPGQIAFDTSRVGLTIAKVG